MHYPLNIEIDRRCAYSPKDWGYEKWTVSREDAWTKGLDHIRLDRLKLITMDWREGQQEYVRLDLGALKALWTHRKEITPWLKRDPPQGFSFFQFYFDGTVFLNEYEVECVFYMRYGLDLWYPAYPYSPKYDWFWGATPLQKDWGYEFPSLVLPIN